MQCLLSVGPEGQIVVSTAESPLAKDRERFFNALKAEAELGTTEEGQRLVRFFAATWLCSIQKSFQFTLPEALASAWLPEVSRVTIIGLGDTLEIWTAENWVSDAARTSADYESLLDRILGRRDE